MDPATGQRTEIMSICLCFSNENPSTWEMQVLAPPDDLIATPQLHFELGNLLPDTLYSILVKVLLKNLDNAPQSEILQVRTYAASSPATTLPPEIPVDPSLTSVEVNSTWARLTWRKFSDFELQFIDGVQLRYKELDGKVKSHHSDAADRSSTDSCCCTLQVYSATPLIHRSVTSYTIEDLKPNTKYEIGLFFIPFPGQTTELQSKENIHVTTSLENGKLLCCPSVLMSFTRSTHGFFLLITDPYKFDIQLELLSKKSTSVEVTWAGVPYPEDKYVNIYRVIYQSEAGKEDFNSFKVAKRDASPKTLITKLKPATR